MLLSFMRYRAVRAYLTSLYLNYIHINYILVI